MLMRMLWQRKKLARTVVVAELYNRYNKRRLKKMEIRYLPHD